MNPPARPQRDPIRVEASAGLRNPLAALSVLVVVLAGCVGVAPTAEEPGPEARLEPAPASFEPIGPDAPGLSVREEDNRTLYTISDEDLEYRNMTVTYALRANEPLRFGVRTERSLALDAWPPHGWVRHGAVLHGVPVDGIWGSSPLGEMAGAFTDNFHWTFVGESDIRAHAAVDGETVASVARDQPLPPPGNIGGTSGSLGMDTNLSRGDWVVVYLGGASPGVNDETKVLHTVAATESFDVFRLPDRELRWGVGFDTADQAFLSGGVGQFEATLDASISHETEEASYLFLEVDGRGSGEGEIVFPGKNRSMPGIGAVALSSSGGTQIGFEVEEWTGKPVWFLTDAWLPQRTLDVLV